MSNNKQKPDNSANEGTQVDAIVRRMEIIEQDMADDAKNFKGKPFNGRTVAEYFGYQSAAIAALAHTIKLLVKESA